jgi:hypothetical protein
VQRPAAALQSHNITTTPNRSMCGSTINQVRQFWLPCTFGIAGKKRNK